MKKSLLLSILGIYLLAHELYFLPYESMKAKQRLLFFIDHAKTSIDVAMYSFTNKIIAKHLKNAARRGVHLRIVLDYDQNMGDRYSQIGYLAKYKNIDLYTIKGKYVRHGDYYGKMHIKMGIFDHKILTFGSANWTNSAFKSNYELIYFVKDYALAKKALRAFERIVRSARRY